MNTTDCSFMDTALALGRRGLGQVWPNPAVGCVLVRDGYAVGRGWTQPGGRPHAETEAIYRANTMANGATAYITLEPCSHHGCTPPCTDALIASGVVRVVVAIMDPDPRVSGRGFAHLRESGLDVTLGIRSTEAQVDHAGFIMRVTSGRPLVTLKLASTLDGRIATATGESHWITGPTARAYAHRLRAEHDAIMIGIGTACTDDPDLTCRLPGLANRSPVRVIVDSHLRLPWHSKVLTGNTPTWVVCAATLEGTPVNVPATNALNERGVDVIPVSVDHDGRLHPDAMLAALGTRGLTRLLVEGGGQLAATLLSRNLVDRLVWFQAPKIIGGDGVPAVAAFGLGQLSTCPMFRRTQIVVLEGDLMILHRRHVTPSDGDVIR